MDFGGTKTFSPVHIIIANTCLEICHQLQMYYFVEFSHELYVSGQVISL